MASSFAEQVTDASIAATPAPSDRLLDYEAPYLIDKLVDSGTLTSRAEAEHVFGELERYFWLCRATGSSLPMISALVDGVWHQFVLFTREYEAFCREHLGSFCHHSPTPASGPAAEDMAPDDYVRLYEAHFGPLPTVWRDWECLHPAAELRWRRQDDLLTVTVADRRAQLLRGSGNPEVVCRVNARARPALEFIARHPRFLVRELPGLRTPAERVALVRPLVRHGFLRLSI
jgi:hypothetical protein